MFIISDITASRAGQAGIKHGKVIPAARCQAGQGKFPQEKHFLELSLLGFPPVHDSTYEMTFEANFCVF